MFFSYYLASELACCDMLLVQFQSMAIIKINFIVLGFIALVASVGANGDNNLIFDSDR